MKKREADERQGQQQADRRSIAALSLCVRGNLDGVEGVKVPAGRGRRVVGLDSRKAQTQSR